MKKVIFAITIALCSLVPTIYAQTDKAPASATSTKPEKQLSQAEKDNLIKYLEQQNAAMSAQTDMLRLERSERDISDAQRMLIPAQQERAQIIQQIEAKAPGYKWNPQTHKLEKISERQAHQPLNTSMPDSNKVTPTPSPSK